MCCIKGTTKVIELYSSAVKHRGTPHCIFSFPLRVWRWNKPCLQCDWSVLCTMLVVCCNYLVLAIVGSILLSHCAAKFLCASEEQCSYSQAAWEPYQRSTWIQKNSLKLRSLLAYIHPETKWYCLDVQTQAQLITAWMGQWTSLNKEHMDTK